MGRDQVKWFEFLERITAVDLLDAGACLEGVKDAVEENGALAMETARAVRISDWAKKAAHSDGGDGDGDGYGYGDGGGGYGYGYGDGDGDGE